MDNSKKRETLVVNFYGGPGSGKSTMMADVFARLKWNCVSCEMAPEFAKEKTWEDSLFTRSNQIYVFGKQLHAIVRVIDKVDVVITDSPLLLSIVYGNKEGMVFHDLVLATHKRYRTLNIFLRRVKPYDTAGRTQSESDAVWLDGRIMTVLSCSETPFVTVDGIESSVPLVTNMVFGALGLEKRIPEMARPQNDQA